MRKMIRRLAIVPALCTLPLTALATTAELTINGTITPAICTPSFSDAGAIDHGSINPASLSSNEFNRLERKSVQLMVACDAPAAFAFYVRDNRADSVPSGIEGAFTGGAETMLGLGEVDGKKIGAYMLAFDTSAVDGDANPIARVTGTGAWSTVSATPIVVNPAQDIQYSWARGETTAPGSYRSISARLNVDTALNRLDELPNLSGEVNLDGAATLTLFHL